MESALAAIESLEPGERINYTQIARQFGVNRVTLSRRHQGAQGTKKAQYENMQLLNPQQTKDLINYINKQAKNGLFCSNQMVKNFAAEIAGREPGSNWVSRFLKKHEDKLMSAYTTGIDSSRKKADSAFKYSLYFEALKRKMDEYDIQPEDTYNMDEKGFLIGIISKAKRIFSKESFINGGIKQHLQDGNREWITTIACICADGSSLSPGLIYQSSASNIQDTWLQDFNPEDHNCFFTSSASGWTNHDIGLAWVRDIFDRETKAKARRRWRLLFLDGHGSHVTMKFLDYCEANKILMATYPPHSTHSLQPLDVGIFSPLSKAYSDELEAFLHASQGLSAITKRDFFRLFWKAWNKALSPANIASSWRATGLLPWDPEVVLVRFRENTIQRPSSSESSRSVLQADDWRRIERLLKKAVADLHDENTKKLSLTMHHLSTENIMLKSRCKGLEEALLNEKKRRQRGKPLAFQLQAPESGNAVFYSPRKIQQARDLQNQKNEDIQQARIAKEEAKLRRQQEKEEKKRVAEEQKRNKALKRQIRLQEAEEKKCQNKRQKEEARIAKEAEIQLQNDIKASKQSKAKPLATPKAHKKQRHPPQAPEVIPEPPTTVNRRGRQIHLPHRFREL